ncbi:unnamed protein product [Urochloa humidicola]
MNELCDLKVHINGHHTLHLHQSVMCAFSGRLRTMVKQEKKAVRIRKQEALSITIRLADFPGGDDGFELVARFCYNNGRVLLCPSNLPLLHCAAVFLEMTEEVCACNLLAQAEAFVNGLYYWTWADVLTAVKSCEPFATAADASGLLDRLISALFSKITAGAGGPETPPARRSGSSSSCSSSPDTLGFGRSLSTAKTPESMRPCAGREWWFDDMTALSPQTIEKAMRVLGSYGVENKNLILTRFLLHYLRAATRRPAMSVALCKEDEMATLAGLADTAVHGVALVGGTAFSCRGLFWVLRIVSAVGMSRECRHKLERLMGLMLDQATLDDLLVSGDSGGVYDVNLVMRLVRVFVGSEEEADAPSQRMRKVGRLIDKYLGEISPDHALKVSKFLAVAESLPDSARDCYDGVYRALDIYLESHPALSLEDRTTLCRCLNYEKLTLEACKDLAKNRRIPPGVAVQALASQQCKLQISKPAAAASAKESRPDASRTPRRVSRASARSRSASVDLGGGDEKELLRLNLQRMQSRVVELERACKEMKGQMSKMTKGKSSLSLGAASCHQTGGRGLPRLC